MENSRREGKRGRLAAAGLSHFVAGESGRAERCVQNDSRMEARGGGGLARRVECAVAVRWQLVLASDNIAATK